MGNSELNEYLSQKISWIKTPVKRFVAGVVATVAFTVISVFIILKVWEFVWNLKISDYNEVIVSSLVITFFISLFFHGRAFLIQWKQSAVEAERYQKESITATYENLKNQVNPHFLFNSLNALTNLVYEDQDKAAKFIKQLSDVYRYVLDSRDKELVSLEDELAFLRSYVYLQEIRFGSNLQVSIHDIRDHGKVAPLALQLLVENAIKHNIVSKEQPLKISIHLDQNYLVVENNLQRKMTMGESSPGMGLDNIRNRYKFLTDRLVQVEALADRFVVKVPIIEMEKS
jgi:Putative regulator of cell autolysis